MGHQWRMARPILVVIIVTTLVSVVCSSAGVVGDSPWAKDSDYVQRRRIQRSPTATADITRGVCVSLCNCTVENVIFLNVQCDFAQNKEYILDERAEVPISTLTFHVSLGPNSGLSIRGKVFHRINRISIDGGVSGGRQQINFDPKAFHDNIAPFPEIDLKHAQKFHIHGNAFQGDFKLNVANVDNVIVHENAFQNTSFKGRFSNIGNLRFEKDAFLGTRMSQIEIVDSNVGLLERMVASMHEIKLQNCRIDTIKARTFDVVSIKSIVLDNCDIQVIEANFTTDKLMNDHLSIVGCRIGTIRSNAIAKSGFHSIEIARNKIDTIEAAAIRATAIYLTFADNEVTNTGRHWLAINEWSAVKMTNNSFGHYDAVEVLGNGKTCEFTGNSITQWAERSLAAMADACQFQDNVFSAECTCNLEWLDQLSPPRREQLRRTSYCQIDHRLRRCFNATTFNAHKFYQMLCGESPSLDCSKIMAEKKVEANFLDPNESTRSRQQYEMYLYLLAGLICFVVLTVLLVIILRVRCRSKPPRHDMMSASGPSQITLSRQTHFPASAPQQTTAGTPAASGTTLHQNKSVKTFTGHDRAIVDLALERLRVKHPRDLFEQVDSYTAKLMTQHLSETEKVLTIGEIVRLLDECENIGDDFLAFTDLLYRHLDENNGQTTVPERRAAGGGDPLYAEPGLMGTQTPGSTTIIHESDNHIYAEPNNSAQQPLLKTEYSMPMDRSEQQATIVYADPVATQKNDMSTRLVSPYAIGSTALPPPPPPVVSNLPDVLSRSIVGGKAVPPPTLPPPPKLNTFGKSAMSSSGADQQQPGTSRGTIPMYSIPQKGSGAAGDSGSQRKPLQRDNSSSSSNSSSNHSGGSDITFKIDDIND